jgi:hypothetical protein
MSDYRRKPLNEGYQKSYRSDDRRRAPAPQPQTPRDELVREQPARRSGQVSREERRSD